MIDTRELRMVLSCNGRTLPLGKHEDFDIEKIEGLESADFQLQSSDMALVDGEDILGKKIAARTIHIEASLHDDEYNESYREQLIRFFNPKHTGTLYINNMGVERQIDYEIEGWTFQQKDLWEPLKFIADLICPDPYMLGLDATGTRVDKKKKMFAFPWVCLKQKTILEPPDNLRGYQGQIMGYVIRDYIAEIHNDGDVPTGFIVTIRARKGTAKNPKIMNANTGQYIKVLIDLVQGDVLVITMSERVRTIKLNGQNVYMKIDRSSSPFMLEAGDNELEFWADENYQNLEIGLSYTLRYLGV